ncbi:MAG: transposase [Lachnospiraceae bacterium]|nr:transposase [Lachnospiraceae bacterium]
MLHTMQIEVHNDHPLYPYFDTVLHLANNLYNVSLYHIRQVMTGIQKVQEDRQPNERDVIEGIHRALPMMKDKFQMPTKENWLLNYYFLNEYFLKTDNPDYQAPALPRQCAQNMIRKAVADMISYLASLKKYRLDPSAYLGMPKLPGYKKSGGMCSMDFSNQTCRIIRESGKDVLSFGKTKARLVLGKVLKSGWSLRQVMVKPRFDLFTVNIVLEDGIPQVDLMSETPERICAIDLGIRNFAAISNNAGLPAILFKGGIIKSNNQWFSKKCAKLQSEQAAGATNRFRSTPEYRKLGRKRQDQMKDFMHKTAKRLIRWCLENRIDTVVVGTNSGWKQNASMSKENNQVFEQIPFEQFRKMLKYLCEWNGIRYVEQEESYTSQASFLMQDPIPVYKKGDSTKYRFSGRRSPKKHKEKSKKSGFHGLYQNNDGTIVNADLNGSANIGRKCYPDLFQPQNVNLNDVLVFTHPDFIKM